MVTKEKENKRPLSPTQIIVLGFAVIICVGTILLMLPISSSDGTVMHALDALFTATSGTCVTGLSVMDVGAKLTTFGQIVLLLLIQVGGLGFMAMATTIQIIIGKRIGLRERMLLRESLNESGVGGMVSLMRWAIFSTLTLEFIGTLLLAIRMIPKYTPGRGLYYALFHSVSAYCNAGFDLIGGGNSYVCVQDDPVILITTILLVVFGGLGFHVQRDICKNRLHFNKYMLQTKIVLTMTAALLLSGTVFVLFAEWSNEATLAPMSVPMKLLNALFESMTLRTAGYATFDQAGMRGATKLFSCILMFVGAAPASTGGGAKVTTFALMIFLLRNVVRGKSEVTAFKRTLPRDLVQRGISLLCIMLTVLLLNSITLCLTEPTQDPTNVLFLCTSAIGTVGLAPFDCAALSVPGKCIIIVMMFMGRVGPLSLMLALAKKQNSNREGLRFPEERIMVG